jgi:hypothetical protein
MTPAREHAAEPRRTGAIPLRVAGHNSPEHSAPAALQPNTISNRSEAS